MHVSKVGHKEECGGTVCLESEQKFATKPRKAGLETRYIGSPGTESYAVFANDDFTFDKKLLTGLYYKRMKKDGSYYELNCQTKTREKNYSPIHRISSEDALSVFLCISSLLWIYLTNP